MAAFLDLPDELIRDIAFLLEPTDVVALGASCQRTHKRTWHERFCERARVDAEALVLFDRMLSTKQRRDERIEAIAALGYDVKDLLLRLQDETPETAQDVLARRYHASIIIGLIHRSKALDTWTRLRNWKLRSERSVEGGHVEQQLLGALRVPLEEAMVAFDLFILAGKSGDAEDVDRKISELAHSIRQTIRGFDELPVGQKAVRIAEYLKSVGFEWEDTEGCHEQGDNLISYALLCVPYHPLLPLQWAIIYCCVARRLGVNAVLSNSLQHVRVFVDAAQGQASSGHDSASIEELSRGLILMDPWSKSSEAHQRDIPSNLSPPGLRPDIRLTRTEPLVTTKLVQCTGKKIIDCKDFMEDLGLPLAVSHGGLTGHTLDPHTVDYAVLWAFSILGAGTFRPMPRQEVWFNLMRHWNIHFPEDTGLIERLPYLFPEVPWMDEITAITERCREIDASDRVPTPRNGLTRVRYRIGQHFRHKRYNYSGFIVGWDEHCAAGDNWIEQMGVDSLPGGRRQPFYNIVAHDKTTRYVAEENIELDYRRPQKALLQLAGKYFKRWDKDRGMFESNMRDDYPDD
ncbi:Hemimethylated DNA-binding protein YccV like-domain-containing protein [Xylariaceae sp. FL0804]|nr:Hemimethylated DNA-binding protein YccV like-domain-containing protein [Xylariaceae sp. FL0804]